MPRFLQQKQGKDSSFSNNNSNNNAKTPTPPTTTTTMPRFLQRKKCKDSSSSSSNNNNINAKTPAKATRHTYKHTEEELYKIAQKLSSTCHYEQQRVLQTIGATLPDVRKHETHPGNNAESFCCMQLRLLVQLRVCSLSGMRHEWHVTVV
jgi:hypothetical protein